MAAPQIPNLLANRGKHLRGQGGNQAIDLTSKVESAGAQAQKDKIVQQTDTDASISRVSAVQAGLLEDEFAHEFAPSPPPGVPHRRFPIINRGTYVRTRAIDRLVDDFLCSVPGTRKQIISLGAGSDTRFFRLMSRSDPPNVLYHELDFPENTLAKVAAIRKSSVARALLEDSSTTTWTTNEIHGSDYHLHAVDLRRLSHAAAPPEHGEVLRQVDPDLPTLLLSECCLTYLKPDAADGVVKHFVSARLSPSTPVGLVLYEPINPSDAFGKVMVANLASRGIVLQTLHKYCSLKAQLARLVAYGLDSGQEAVDVDFLYECWIGGDEKARVAQAEMLDEVEELKLLLQHYCIAWGWRDGSDTGAPVWDSWKMLRSQPTKP